MVIIDDLVVEAVIIVLLELQVLVLLVNDMQAELWIASQADDEALDDLVILEDDQQLLVVDLV